MPQIKGLPFGNIFSVSDGPADNSTGVIYFYVTPMDTTVSDLRSNPHASLTFSEAEGEFCRQVPTCQTNLARLICKETSELVHKF